MKSFNLLQTIPIDTLDIEAHLTAVTEKLTTTPVTELLSELLDKAVSFGLKVLAAIIIYILGAWAIKKIKAIIARVFERKDADAAISSFIQSIVGIALTILLILTTIGVLGINTTSFAALLAGGGMAIGMALNGTVQNFAGGIMLIVFKPFKAGDYIQAQGYEGTVTELNIVSTKLTTTDNKCIIIPNGILSNGTINNFSQNNIRRLEWAVSVEYGSSVAETKQVLTELLAGEDRILTVARDAAPADPLVALSSLSDSSIIFIMRAWVKSSDYWDVNFLMNEKIYNELPSHGIEFPYPQLDVHVHQDSNS